MGADTPKNEKAKDIPAGVDATPFKDSPKEIVLKRVQEWQRIKSEYLSKIEDYEGLDSNETRSNDTEDVLNGAIRTLIEYDILHGTKTAEACAKKASETYERDTSFDKMFRMGYLEFLLNLDFGKWGYLVPEKNLSDYPALSKTVAGKIYANYFLADTEFRQQFRDKDPFGNQGATLRRYKEYLKSEVMYNWNEFEKIKFSDLVEGVYERLKAENPVKQDSELKLKASASILAHEEMARKEKEIKVLSPDQWLKKEFPPVK